MTALVMMRADDGIILASDGAAYTDDGILQSVATKVAMMPEWSCVLAGRGIGCAVPRMHLMLQNMTRNGISIAGFDDVLQSLPDLSMLLAQQYEQNLPGEQHFSFLIGGFSEARQAWESYVLRSRDYGLGEMEIEAEQAAFKLTRLPCVHIAGVPSDESSRHAGVNVTGRDFDPASEAVRLVCAARLDRGWSVGALDAPPRYFIGGFVQLTVLNSQGVTSSIVHRWPDPIGEPILPRGELLPEYLRAVSI